MQPLLIHHHMPKTAGSSIGVVVRANFRGGGLFQDDTRQVLGREYREKELGDRPIREALLRYWRDWYRSMTPEQRAHVRCVRSHTAQCLIPAVDDRAVRPFTVLRDPVERAASAYTWTLAMWDLGSRQGVNEQLGGWQLVARTVLENRWTLADIYRELGGADVSPLAREVFSFFFNGQAREVLYPYLDANELPITTDPSELEDYRRRAADILSTYVVGTQDHLSQSIRLFADTFGWRTAFVPRTNVTPSRGEIDDETRSLIRAHNSVDAELHARYSAELARLPPTGRLTNMRGNAQRRARRGAARARRAVRLRSRARRAVRLTRF